MNRTTQILTYTLLALVGAGILTMQVKATESQGTARSASGDMNSASSTQVTIDNFSFGPQTLTVPTGTKVTWINRDDIPHTVVENDQKFKSKALDTDQSFDHTFTEPGTYSYFCSLHPKMVGKIVVQAGK